MSAKEENIKRLRIKYRQLKDLLKDKEEEIRDYQDKIKEQKIELKNLNSARQQYIDRIARESTQREQALQKAKRWKDLHVKVSNNTKHQESQHANQIEKLRRIEKSAPKLASTIHDQSQQIKQLQDRLEELWQRYSQAIDKRVPSITDSNMRHLKS